MDEHSLRRIVGGLPQGRTIFHYFKDRYALMLLSEFVGEGRAVRDVKQSPFGQLLSKPLVRDLMARANGDQLSSALFDGHWPADVEAYLLTLGRWGDQVKQTEDEIGWERGYHQMVRPGENLVLQLNFNKKHNEAAQRLLGFDGSVFNYDGHPINKLGRQTLAWARIDIERADGEALIEEVQSDWVRIAYSSRNYIRSELRLGADEDVVMRGKKFKVRDLDNYLEQTLEPHRQLWEEAILSASIWFLRHELGLRRIYYYTADTGARLKGLQHGRHPPRSLYTKLPRKFCFQETADPPRFVATNPENYVRCQLRNGLKWYLLEL